MIYKNKRILLLAALLLALLLVVAGGVTYMFQTINGDTGNKKVIEDPSFTNIEVLTNNADVEIVPTKSSVATVEYTGASKKAKFRFDVDVKRDTLSVHLKEKRRFLFWFNFNTKELKLTVSLPEKQYEHIQVESDNGRIHAEEIKAEQLTLETDNGQISLDKVEVELADVETDNGAVILDHVEGEVKAGLDNGRVTVITENLDDWPLDLETDNGRIEIKTETEPTNATIEAETDNGKISIFGNENKLTTYGKGKNSIELRTDNGRITVEK